MWARWKNREDLLTMGYGSPYSTGALANVARVFGTASFVCMASPSFREPWHPWIPGADTVLGGAESRAENSH